MGAAAVGSHASLRISPRRTGQYRLDALWRSHNRWLCGSRRKADSIRWRISNVDRASGSLSAFAGAWGSDRIASSGRRRYLANGHHRFWWQPVGADSQRRTDEHPVAGSQLSRRGVVGDCAEWCSEVGAGSNRHW